MSPDLNLDTSSCVETQSSSKGLLVSRECLLFLDPYHLLQVYHSFILKRHFLSAPADYTQAYAADHMRQTMRLHLTMCPGQSQQKLLLPKTHWLFVFKGADSEHGTAALPRSRLLFPGQDLLTQCSADYFKRSCEVWQQISCMREREKTSRAGLD